MAQQQVTLEDLLAIAIQQIELLDKTSLPALLVEWRDMAKGRESADLNQNRDDISLTYLKSAELQPATHTTKG